jgi:RNA chaperone Hfq
MPLHNQTAFLNNCQSKKLDVTIALGAGIALQGIITSSDQFTVIINDKDNNLNQQVDFLNHYKKNKSIVTVILPMGQPIQGVITASDMYTVILNDSIMLYKSNIGAINPIGTDTALIFKNDIVAVTI